MKPKTRGNGQGTAYKRGKTWEAQVVIGYRPNSQEGGSPVPIKRRKGGFATKRDALAYCVDLYKGTVEAKNITLDQVYTQWYKRHESRVSAKTMEGYSAAYKHFSPLHHRYIRSITAKDLQECMDACPAGKRTHQLMQVTAGLIWAYAYDADYVEKDVTGHLYTGKGTVQQRQPLTDEEVKKIHDAIGVEPYAEYVYAMCYLGFRPSEFLSLRKEDYHEEEGVVYLVGGSKTEAGRNRRVPVPELIMTIIRERLKAASEFLFANYNGKKMSEFYFREYVFRPLMARLGIEGKVPYSTRHTYSDKLKYVDGDDKTKAAVMGHTDYGFTQKAYQSTSLEEIKRIADSIV